MLRDSQHRISAALAVVAVACACSGSRAVPINEVLIDHTGRVLHIGYNACGPTSVKPEVDESPSVVSIRVVVTGENQGDCVDAIEIRLSAPLDGRSVVDASNGRKILVQRAPG